jgi:hypothetical protein
VAFASVLALVLVPAAAAVEEGRVWNGAPPALALPLLLPLPLPLPLPTAAPALLPPGAARCRACDADGT